MISTQERESITIQVTPDITAKAASLAVKKRKTTLSIMEEWLIERAATYDLPGEEQEEGAAK